MIHAASNRQWKAIVFSLVVCVATVGCSGGGARPGSAAYPQKAASARKAASSPSILIEVTELPAADRWEVRYRLPHPAPAIRLSKSHNIYRSKRWKPVSPEGSGKPPVWEVVGAREILMVEDPASPTTSFAVSFESDFDEKPKAYELHVHFTDGSRLLFTGDLQVTPLFCPEAGECTKDTLRQAKTKYSSRYLFRTRAGRTIIANDKRAARELAWQAAEDDRDKRTYAYFGSIEPIETGLGTFLVDPGFPPWFLEKTRELLPWLVDYYRELTGFSMDFRPSFFISYHPTRSTGAGFSMGGGILNRIVQLAVHSRLSDVENQEDLSRWAHMVAHEVFHLWNGSVVRQRL